VFPFLALATPSLGGAAATTAAIRLFFSIISLLLLKVKKQIFLY
jgi:hypothetical protein